MEFCLLFLASSTGPIGISSGSTPGGLTQNELEDLLSLDDIVMNDVCELYKPPLRRLPAMMLVRLLADLDAYWLSTSDGVTIPCSLKGSATSDNVDDVMNSVGGVRVGGDRVTIRWANSEIHEGNSVLILSCS